MGARMVDCGDIGAVDNGRLASNRMAVMLAGGGLRHEDNMEGQICATFTLTNTQATYYKWR